MRREKVVCASTCRKTFAAGSEVVDGVNFLFRQIMHERVAEITYDEAAELKFGATYYGTADMPEDQARSASPESALSETAVARKLCAQIGTLSMEQNNRTLMRLSFWLQIARNWTASARDRIAGW